MNLVGIVVIVRPLELDVFHVNVDKHVVKISEGLYSRIIQTVIQNVSYIGKANQKEEKIILEGRKKGDVCKKEVLVVNFLFLVKEGNH